MYSGVYEGIAAAVQPKRILILGESHHDLDPFGTTRQVVEDYLNAENTTKQSLQFFHKIALSFGIDTGKDEEKVLFWDKVFFGNYVEDSLDGPGGEGDKTAEKLIAANRKLYNQNLARMVREHAIDRVFCFSDKVFDALPWAPALFPDVFQKIRGKQISLWFARAYGPDSIFGRSVEIYGTPHPTYWRYTGLGAEDIAPYLKPVFEECCGSPGASPTAG